MSKESFARGFCKVAEAHGVDPVALAKYAAGKKVDKWNPLGPEGFVADNAVTNDTGVYHLPSPMGGSGWLSGEKSHLLFSPGHVDLVPSRSSITNSPHATWLRTLFSKPEPAGRAGRATVSFPRGEVEKPFFKKVEKKDGTVVNVPNDMDALSILQAISGRKEK